MKFKLFVYFLFLFLVGISLAQGWMHNYGGSGNDYGMSVTPTIDGGYVIAGFTNGYGARQSALFLLKVDSNGKLIWRRVIDNASSDYGNYIHCTSDSGFIVTGRSYNKLWVLKLDCDGDTIWTYTDETESEGLFVQQTIDNGYIVVGWSYRDYSIMDYGRKVYILKFNSSGDTVWTRTYGNGKGYYAQQTSDGGYIVTGEHKKYSYGSYGDILLMKTDSKGWEEWTKIFGGKYNDIGRYVKQTPDSGYILAGYTYLRSKYYDGWLIKTNSLGDTIWTRTYGGNGDDLIYSLEQLDDGGYMLIGTTNSSGARNGDLWIIRTDSLGDILFTKKFGGLGKDVGTCIRRTSDGNFIISGYTRSLGIGYDVYLIKIDEYGKILR